MEKKHIYLEGIGLSNYRGFGKKYTYLAPFQRFNFFIGPNNSGKSSILNFLNEQLPRISKNQSLIQEMKLGILDVNILSKSSPVQIGLAISPQIILDSIKELPHWSQLINPPVHLRVFDDLVKACTKDGLAWFERDRSGLNALKAFPLPTTEILERSHSAQILNNLFRASSHMSGGNLTVWADTLKQQMLDVANKAINLPDVALIPAIRQISLTGPESEADWSGRGLIEKLKKLQNPDHTEQENKRKFQAINRFIQAVTGNHELQIEIPHTLRDVLVHMDGKTLPISVLGTGIHEILIIATVCTLLDEKIICIEEPEIHLHPLLQRRLIDYLKKETTNQYFIATHSASIIDAVEAGVFNVSTEEGQTEVSIIGTASSRFKTFRSLGYKASDLLQANSIIWVEGPSDRIYINHWIAAIDPTLLEGIHYSIIFYGGRLLSHLTASDIEENEKDIEALIAVRKLNRHLCVVIDSDRSAKDSPINTTKQRILDELKQDNSVGWLTAGREIENYVDDSIMTAALSKIYAKRYDKRSGRGNFDHVLHFKAKDKTLVKDVDKVRIAVEVCTRAANLDVLDLHSKIGEVVNFIREANK